MTRSRGGGALAGIAILVALLVAAPAQAAFPGKNGKIVYQSDRAGQPDVWIVNGDGTHPVNLTTNITEFAQDPAFSADGKRIVFAVGGKIATMNADGSNLNLTAVDASLFFGPIFTPNGDKIVFEKENAANTGAELMIVNADGSGTPQTIQTGGTATTQEIGPAFSPDGNQLAFTSNRGANNDLYLAAGNGSGAVNFSNRATFDLGADFSPDGSRLLWTNSVGATSTLLIAPVSPIGATPTPVPASGIGPFAGPVFSPDGTRVAYTSTAKGGDADVLTSALDGSNLVDVSDGPTSNVASDAGPSWAPLTDAARKLTLKYKRRKARLKGTLTSTDPGCEDGARVKVFKKHRGKDPKIAKTDTTPNGKFKAKAKHLSGKFYATVGADARIGVANCLAAKSPKLKLR